MQWLSILRSAGRVDLAAPGNKDLILCEKCFAMMPSDAEYCSECGAPMTDAPGVAGSDTEVYPELAKANVLRMRKEFKSAEDVCLAILRRFPNNMSANTLLGDIATETGQLEQAVEWYELALDIVPDSEENQQKLEAVRTRLAEKRTQTAVENLGIPQKKPPYLLLGLTIMVVAAFLIAAIVMMNRANQRTGPNPNNPVVVNGTEDTGPKPVEPPPTPDIDAGPQDYIENQDLALRVCRELGIDPTRVPAFEIGDRDGDLRITLNTVMVDGEWPLRAKLVRKGFELAPKAGQIELTVQDGDRTVTQLILRSAYEKTLDPAFDVLNDSLLVETLLSYKMPLPPDPVAPPTDSGTTVPPTGPDGSRGAGGADDAGGN